MPDHPNTAYSKAEAMDLHDRVCGSDFFPWKATKVWFQCPKGHVFWEQDDVFWCRPAMEGHA